MCITTPVTGLMPEGERMSFCNQMTAAIDGARTLTRLDHLSRSIWRWCKIPCFGLWLSEG